jgi:pimeloyl-ACP methyl ester carboxylesterase
LLPGIMGTELLDADGRVVWGLKPSFLFRPGKVRDTISRLGRLREDGHDLHPGQPIRFPGWLPMLDGIEPYERILARLQSVALRPEAVLAFGYDWRRSIEDNARLLAEATESHHRQWCDTFAGLPREERGGSEEPRVTFVCHSMGGLVATWYARFSDQQQLTRRVITLGTPFTGAVKAARLLAAGDVMKFGVFADEVRDATRAMPGVYDLLPTYPCIGESELRSPTTEDITILGGDGQLAAEAAVRAAQRTAAGGQPVEVRSLVGDSQPTLLSWRRTGETTEFLKTLGGKPLTGDSTVFAGSAFTMDTKPSQYLPQKHGTLASTDESLSFVQSILREDELRQYQASDGAGLELPTMVAADEPFEIEVTSWDGAASIRVAHAEGNQGIAEFHPIRRDGRLVVTTSLPDAGLFRVALTAGGHSDVSELIGAVAPSDLDG